MTSLDSTDKAEKAITKVLLKADQRGKHLCDIPSSFMLKVIRLTHSSRIPLKTLSASTDIPYPWLIEFLRGEICNPSINRTLSLYEAVVQGRTSAFGEYEKTLREVS